MPGLVDMERVEMPKNGKKAKARPRKNKVHISRIERIQRVFRAPLSKRALQVLIALGEGRETTEICAALRISLKTGQSYADRLKGTW